MQIEYAERDDALLRFLISDRFISSLDLHDYVESTEITSLFPERDIYIEGITALIKLL
jgi:hypothetical protein